MQNKNIGKIFTKNLLITEIILIIIMIVLGTFVFHYVEGWRLLDSLYFIINTMSTIGLGDFVPQTDTGKIFVMFYAVVGVPFFVSIGGLFLETRFKKAIEHYLKKVYREIRETEEEIETIEATVNRKFKRSGENMQEVVKTATEEIIQTEKKSRWKRGRR